MAFSLLELDPGRRQQCHATQADQQKTKNFSTLEPCL